MGAEAWIFLGVAVTAFSALMETQRRDRADRHDDRRDDSHEAVNAALDTTKVMQNLIMPLRQRLEEVEQKVAELQGYVAVLQQQIRDLGHEPVPPSTVIIRRHSRNEGEES